MFQTATGIQIHGFITTLCMPNKIENFFSLQEEFLIIFFCINQQISCFIYEIELKGTVQNVAQCPFILENSKSCPGVIPFR